jgi:hypothetical protein
MPVKEYPQKPIEEKVKRGKGRVIEVELTAGEADVLCGLFLAGIVPATSLICSMPKHKKDSRLLILKRCKEIIERIHYLERDLAKEKRPV